MKTSASLRGAKRVLSILLCLVLALGLLPVSALAATRSWTAGNSLNAMRVTGSYGSAVNVTLTEGQLHEQWKLDMKNSIDKVSIIGAAAAEAGKTYTVHLRALPRDGGMESLWNPQQSYDTVTYSCDIEITNDKNCVLKVVLYDFGIPDQGNYKGFKKINSLKISGNVQVELRNSSIGGAVFYDYDAPDHKVTEDGTLTLENTVNNFVCAASLTTYRGKVSGYAILDNPKSLDDCSVTVRAGASLTMNGGLYKKLTVAHSAAGQSAVTLKNMTVPADASPALRGACELSLIKTTLEGKLTFDGRDRSTAAAYTFRLDNATMHESVLADNYARLTISLAGANAVTTDNRVNGVGVCPDLMVADTATLTIEDDPAKPDVGSLSFGQFDTNIVYGDPVYWDGGHYYCAAIGGAPALDPKPHGDIFIRSGVINAQAQEGGAAIGGSMSDASVAYKYLQYTGDLNNLVVYDADRYLYRVPGEAQFDPELGGYPVDDAGYAVTYDSQGVRWNVPTNVRDPENDVLGFSRDGGRVVITGGVVNAIASAGGAAIGGAVGGNGGAIYIRGGTVNASARMGAAALGAGERVKVHDEPRGGAGGIIEISGGCVVNCQSENNYYTLRGEPKNSYNPGDEFLNDYTGDYLGAYYENQGNVIGYSARSQMRASDYVKIYSGKGVDPVVILQQHVSNAYSPELDASWNNFLWPEDSARHHVVIDGKQCSPTQISGGMIILIGRECRKDANGFPVDSQGRPLRDAEGNLAYDIDGSVYRPDEYAYGEEVREISTHVISGWSDYGVEVPLRHNNYRVRGQISLPAWEDPWYSAERFTEFTLPKDSTITLLDGAVMNVSAGFKVHGTEEQLVTEDGAVIQGGGIWPGKPLNAPSTAPTEAEVKDLLDYLRTHEPGQENNTGAEAESGSRTIVTHLGVAKAGNGNRYIIPGDSADEIRTAAAKDGSQLLTVINAGYCGFRQQASGAWNLLISNQNTVVSLIENGALCAVPSSRSNALALSVAEDNGVVTISGANGKLSSPDYVVYENREGGAISISFSPDDDYSSELAFMVNIENPENNKAVFSVPNFMGSKFRLDSVAPLKDKCALRYGGELSFKTPVAEFAEININQLQLNYGGKVALLGGIEGGGSVQVPEFGGFPVSGGAEMYLNTFGGSQELSMSLELETPIFEGAFEASFKEVRGSGIIVPDTLKAELAVGEGGIPLVPPTVIGYLQGGGLGFEGLADTINMDSFGAPPIRLYISAKASLLDVLEGKAEVSVGPSGFDVNMTDVEIKGLDLIEEYGVSASWDAGKRMVYGREYWGLNADMNQHLRIGVGYNGKKVLIAQGQIGVGGFSGYKIEGRDAYVVIQLEGYGKLNGTVQIPAGIVGPLPARDHTLASGEIAFYTAAGATNTINADKVQGSSPTKALRELVKSTKLHFDAAVGAQATINSPFWPIPTCYAKVTYVFGGTSVKFDVSDEKGEPLDLRSLVNASAEPAQTYTMLTTVEDVETGEEIPAIVEVGVVTVASLQASGSEDNEDVVLRRVPQTPGDAVLFEDVSAFEAEVKPAALGKVLIAIKSEDPNQALDDICLTVTRSGAAGNQLVPVQYDANGDLIDNGGNFFPGQGVAYFAPPEAGVYTVTSKVPLETAEVLKMVPFAVLGDATAVSASGASYSVQDANADRPYKVQVYLGAEPGAGDYLLAETELSGETAYSGAFENFSLTGAAAPTGSYYPSVVLLEYVSATDENGETVATWSPVDRKELSSTVQYTNTVTPAAPENVTLAYSGNATMTASWNAAANADSYLLVVYDAQGSDTGLLFQVSRAEGEEAPATSIIMDLSSLDAGQNYSVGVKALITDGDDLIASCEGKSAPATLNAATPPALTWSENVTVTENGGRVVTAGVSAESRQFTVSGGKALNFEVTNAATGALVARQDGTAALTVTIPEEAEENAVLRVVATDPATLDYAFESVTVSSDAVAPTLALDNLGVFPLMETEAGCVANVTGLSEPGATLLVWGEREVPVLNSFGNFDHMENETILAASQRVGEDGRFSISLSFDSLLQSKLSVQAEDAAGNLSDPVKITFPQEAANTVAVAFNPNGEGAVCSAARVDVVSGTPIGTLPAAYWQDDEKLFDGWYTADGTPVTTATIFTTPEPVPVDPDDPDSPVETPPVTVYARWADSVTVAFNSGDSATCDTASLAVKAGAPIGALPTPRWNESGDMLFLGWFTEPGGGTSVTEASAFGADTTLYARFSPYVTVTLASGVGSCAVSALQVPTGGAIASLPTPTAKGYAFGGWYAGETPVTAATVFSEDATLTAEWTRNTMPLAVAQESCGDDAELPDPVFTPPDKTIGAPSVSYSGTTATGTTYRSTAKPTLPGTYVVTAQCDTFECAYVGSAEFMIWPTGANASVRAALQGSTLTPFVTAAAGDYLLIAASYTQKGRQLDLTTAPVYLAGPTPNLQLAPITLAEGARYRLILVDRATLAPVCPAWLGKAGE